MFVKFVPIDATEADVRVGLSGMFPEINLDSVAIIMYDLLFCFTMSPFIKTLVLVPAMGHV